MRRGWRHLFTIISALSLLLCAAVCVVWVRSYWCADSIKWSRWNYNGASINAQLDERTIQVGRGIVCLGHHFSHGSTSYHSGLLGQHGPRDSWIEWETNPAANSVVVGGTGFWNRRGFAYVHNRSGNYSGTFSWWRGGMFPLWAAFSMFLVFPATAGIASARRRRQKCRGLCTNCGYDLRAHRGGERCPECGGPITAA